MARKRRGKMALYEVMSKAKDKPGYKRTLDKIRTTGQPSDEEPVLEKEETVVAETAVEEDTELLAQDETSVPEEQETVDDDVLAVQWRRKPRVVQYNNGRVEFSVPYQIGIAVVLGLVVVILLAFRAGQRSLVVDKVGPSGTAFVSGSGNPDAVITGNEGNVEEVDPGIETAKDDGNPPAVTSTGGNVIVLAEYHSSRDLDPVRAHFASYGIATEIVPSGSVYFLVTQATYSGPSLSQGSGGEGELAMKKIAEIGKEYKGKAPEGYETFAPHYFGDAYGKLKWY